MNKNDKLFMLMIVIMLIGLVISTFLQWSITGDFVFGTIILFSAWYIYDQILKYKK